MRTIREAINIGARSIYLNDGTLIVHLDHGRTDAMCPPKMIDGKPVYRWLYCRITNTKRKMHFDFLKEKDKLHSIYPYIDYVLSEHDMNEFISLSGGIDEKNTMYWANPWDYSFEDTLDLLIDNLCNL